MTQRGVDPALDLAHRDYGLRACQLRQQSDVLNNPCKPIIRGLAEDPRIGR